MKWRLAGVEVREDDRALPDGAHTERPVAADVEAREGRADARVAEVVGASRTGLPRLNHVGQSIPIHVEDRRALLIPECTAVRDEIGSATRNGRLDDAGEVDVLALVVELRRWKVTRSRSA
jgi:hypothetical protein